MKRVSIYSFLFLFVITLFSSCNTANYVNGASTTSASSKDLSVGQHERKMIYNADVDLKVKDVDTASVQVLDLTEKYNGYLISSSGNYTTVRVASTSLKQFLSELGTIGKVKNEEVYGQDVTDQYFDLTIKLENAEKARQRYLELLNRAVSVQDILAIEKELERLDTDIDRLKGKINQLDHQDAFSKVTIRYNEKKILGPLGYVGLGVYKVVKLLFVIN